MALVFRLICHALLPTLAFERRSSWDKVLLLFGLVGGYFNGTLSPVLAWVMGSSHQHLEREENEYIFACGFKSGNRLGAGCAEGSLLVKGLCWLSPGHGAEGSGNSGWGVRCHTHLPSLGTLTALRKCSFKRVSGATRSRGLSLRGVLWEHHANNEERGKN